MRKIASLVRAYFPQCKSIGCFSRVTDVAAKTDEELAELAMMASVDDADAQPEPEPEPEPKRKKHFWEKWW